MPTVTTPRRPATTPITPRPAEVRESAIDFDKLSFLTNTKPTVSRSGVELMMNTGGMSHGNVFVRSANGKIQVENEDGPYTLKQNELLKLDQSLAKLPARSSKELKAGVAALRKTIGELTADRETMQSLTLLPNVKPKVSRSGSELLVTTGGMSHGNVILRSANGKMQLVNEDGARTLTPAELGLMKARLKPQMRTASPEVKKALTDFFKIADTATAWR